MTKKKVKNKKSNKHIFKNKNKVNVNVNINNSKRSPKKSTKSFKQPPQQPQHQQQDNNQYLYHLLNKFLDDKTTAPALIPLLNPQPVLPQPVPPQPININELPAPQQPPLVVPPPQPPLFVPPAPQPPLFVPPAPQPQLFAPPVNIHQAPINVNNPPPPPININNPPINIHQAPITINTPPQVIQQPFVMPPITINNPPINIHHAPSQDNSQQLYQLLNRFLDDRQISPGLIPPAFSQYGSSPPIYVTTNSSNDLLNRALPIPPEPIPPEPIPPQPIPPEPNPIPRTPSKPGPISKMNLMSEIAAAVKKPTEFLADVRKKNEAIAVAKQKKDEKIEQKEGEQAETKGVKLPSLVDKPKEKSITEFLIESVKNRRESIEPDDNIKPDDKDDWLEEVVFYKDKSLLKTDLPPDKPPPLEEAKEPDEPPDEPPPLEEAKEPDEPPPLKEDKGHDILQKMVSTSTQLPTTSQSFMAAEQKSSGDLLNVSKIGMDIKEESEDERNNRIQENIPVAEEVSVKKDEPIQIHDATQIATNLKEANQMINAANYKLLQESFNAYDKAGGVKMALKKKKGVEKYISTSIKVYDTATANLKQRNDFIEKIKEGTLTKEDKKNIRNFLRDNGETQQKIHASTFNAKLTALEF